MAGVVVGPLQIRVKSERLCGRVQQLWCSQKISVQGWYIAMRQVVVILIITNGVTCPLTRTIFCHVSEIDDTVHQEQSDLARYVGPELTFREGDVGVVIPYNNLVE